MSQLILHLLGPVSLTGPRRENLTPRGMKARAALAIIGSSSNLQVARPKLQDLLFSERDPDHGNASVRQLLREIRLSMGSYREALAAGPGWVGFDRNLITVDVTPVMSLDGRIPEFASDLDVDDPEFEDWLRDARRHAEEYPEQVKAREGHRLPKLHVMETVSADIEARVLGEMIVGEAVGRLFDLLPIETLSNSVDITDSVICLESAAARHGDALILLVKLKHVPSTRVLWTRRFNWKINDLTREMQECAAQICLAVIRSVDAAAELGGTPRLSFSDIFSFSGDRLRRADENLANLDDRTSPEIVMSLRAWVRSTLAFERLTEDPRQTIGEAKEYALKAREKNPLNSTALAVSSFIEFYLDNNYSAYDLARQAVAIEADNPLARLAYSRALYGVDQISQAVNEAEAGLRHPYSNLNPANWHIELGLAMTKLNKIKSAISHFEAANNYAPDNRPALRFLSAIRYELGDEKGARDALLQLKKLEPDFTLELMGSDSYPVDSLRRAGLLKVTKSKLI